MLYGFWSLFSIILSILLGTAKTKVDMSASKKRIIMIMIENDVTVVVGYT